MPPQNKTTKPKGPTKTLTQRRVNNPMDNNSNGGSRLSSFSQPNSGSGLSSFSSNSLSSSPSSSSTGAAEGGGGGSALIIIWAIVILATGIGLALVVRNLTKDEETEPAAEEQSEDTDTEEDTTDDSATDDATTDDTTDDTATDDTTTDDTTDDDLTDDTITDDTTDDTTTDTDTDTLTNAYSKNAQTISDGTTGNVITLTGYRYETFSPNFVYTIKLGQVTTFPGVTAVLDSTAKTLTVVVSNVKTDQIVGNGGSGSTTFAGNGNANTVDVTNASGKSTFVFKLDKATDYKINAVQGTEFDSITIDIKNS